MNSILRIDLPPIRLIEDHTHHGNDGLDHDHNSNATTNPNHNHVADNKLRDTVISNIETYFNSENITFKNVNYKETTEQGISGVPGSMTTLSPVNYATTEEPSNFVMDLLNSLELDDIITILILLLNIDLDRDGTPDIFNLLKGIKNYIYGKPEYKINNDYELQNKLKQYNSKQLSPYGRQKLSEANHSLFTKLVEDNDIGTAYDKGIYAKQKGQGGQGGQGGHGDHATQGTQKSQTSFNGDFVPGYAYTDPHFWESEKRPPPVCIKDKYSIKGPAMVLGDGIAMNALNIQNNLLPQFTYAEKSARQQEIDAFNEHREYSCNEYCSDNCNNEICHALECDNCK